MRAVANGSKGGSRTAFSVLDVKTDGTKFGMPERMSGEQWINRSTHAASMSASSSGSSTASRSGSSSASSSSSTSTSAGTSAGSTASASDRSMGRDIPTGKMEPKNKGKVNKVPSANKNGQPSQTAQGIIQPSGIEIILELEKGMDLRDFSRKARALQDLAERGKLFKAPNPVKRNKNITDTYRKNIREQAETQWGKSEPSRVEKAKEVIKNRQADHMQDLQIMGQDHPANLWLLDSNTNQILGRQVRQQVRNFPDGTPITRIIIKGVNE